MQLIIYNFFLYILYFPYLLIIFLRIFLKKEHTLKFKEKLFFTKVKRPNGPLFWFHVASIGEFNSILPIINYYLKKDSSYNFLITTVTLSSFKEFEKNYGNNSRFFHQFLPFDLNLLVKYFLRSWKPDIISFVDSEIWPNFIFNIKKKNIPLILLNARITKKTLKRWLFLNKFSKIIFGYFSLCIASSNETKKNLELLKAKNIKYFGNIKFCYDNKEKKITDINLLDLKKNNIWCAVSTHEHEELFCAKVHAIIKEKLKGSMCIIIPRHIDRTKKIFFKLQELGFKVQLKNENDLIDTKAEIVLINYYGAVNIYLKKIKNVFIGKSLEKKLIKVGGQNPIEAAKLGCFIFHGPFVYNFAEIYEYLKKNQFCEEIRLPEELADKLIKNFKKSSQKIDEKKLNDLNAFSSLIFKNVIAEYDTLINENL